jgi:hypothetical protein
LPESDVRPYRADGSIALQNVKMGLEAIAPHIDRIKKELPTVDTTALQQLGDLGLAVIYAAAQVDRTSDGSTSEWLEKGRKSRALLLSAAEALVMANVLPEHEVARIKKGKGSIDMAQDNIDLAALFTKHAARFHSPQRLRPTLPLKFQWETYLAAVAFAVSWSA